jgi:signal peptidase I
MTEDTYQWPEEAILLSDEPKPEAKAQHGNWVGGLFREILSTVLPAVLIAVLMHLFLAQSSVVYGESMQPTFFTDQRLIIEKVSYQLHAPERSDVVILRDPDGGALPLIKRVVGMPGERVTVADGRVYIDGLMLDEPYLDEPTDGASRSWVVPPFHVFVMGDNRNNSRDSRFFGPIPTESIMGHAVFRYWPLNELGRPR